MPHDHDDHFHDGHSHDGLSPSGHPYRPDQDHKLTRWQAMEIAMRELLIEKKIVTAAEITATVEQMDRRSPADGAKVVARAWVDPAFKTRLLQDGTEAIKELGIEPGVLKLIAVENSPQIHNVVVCTLCSCYPRNLLGLPPDWYKQRAYRSRVVKTPRKVLAEFGLTLPADIIVRVHDSTADMRYLVIPNRPEGTEALDETALAGLVSRDAMIGVALATHP
ncbi:nitrile hydratase subunit alpha [Roseobacter sp. N2S]|uniref:nitrile hydratase subunit alpha n=1 Tax=Roseobacter sp. N2S TaxID=2663844 RepID=UPI00285C202D|nr:nitrile hydratase subunit alpha [Roseobacter sp. N2S]MDR6264272.1 nitrile hydratase [Roseobacter sp. N2S]